MDWKEHFYVTISVMMHGPFSSRSEGGVGSEIAICGNF